MHAFVPSAGLKTSSTQLSSGLRNVCGATLSPSPVVTRQSNMVRMTGDYGITLQTLIYTSNSVISGIEDKDVNCNMVWKQVFGNAYVMESERAEAYLAESMYRAGQITLREFVRAVGLSDTYRRRFFECCGPYRAVELNFKHFFGRAPISQAELSEHVQIIANEGFEAEINSYIDSMEYEEAFGDDDVPYMRFKGTYATIEEFNRMCTLCLAPGRTDKSLTERARALGIENPNHVLSLDGAGIPSMLVSNIALNGNSSFVPIKKAIPGRPDLDLGQASSTFAAAAAPPINENAVSRKRVEISLGNYMYLTEEEAAEYQKSDTEKARVTGYAEKEISEAQTQISLLQQKIAELSLVQ